ncbi:MAG: hypothetical protein JSW71_05200, partial [Gemmatimonadota bacterium]
RHPTVLPGQEIHIYAYPRSLGGGVTSSRERIMATVLRPDGLTDSIELNDEGRTVPGGADDLAEDGIFTGVYDKTSTKGAYTFLLRAEIDRWVQHSDLEQRAASIVSPRFLREVRLSAAVADPRDVETEPDDPPAEPGPPDWCKWVLILLTVVALILLWLVLQQRRRLRRA